MTDNEIINALQNWCDNNCKKVCPRLKMCDKCIVTYIKRALDLINRQQADMERLTEECDEKINKWKILDERTKQRYAELYEEAKSVVRAEAIREFAERSKEKAIVGRTCDDSKFESVVTVSNIDTIAEELIDKQRREGEG